MRIFGLIEKLEEFKSVHGNIEIDAEYWCADCMDTHTGHGVELSLNCDGKLIISAIHLGLDDEDTP